MQLKSRMAYVCSNKFKFWIGILIAAKVIALTIVAFEWKSSVNTFFESDPDTLFRFFGIFCSAVGVATIALQLFLTRLLLVRRDLSLPILLMPMVLFGVAVFVIVGSGLVIMLAATIGKSLEVWRRSVHDTTLNLLYTKIRRENRRSAISVNGGLVKPLAEVFAASVIFLGASVVNRPLFVVVFLVWILAAVRLIRLVQAPRIKDWYADSPDINAATKLEPKVWSSSPLQA